MVKNMEETDFHILADAVLGAIEQDLEDADQDGYLEVDRVGGVLTLSLPDGKQFVISKHVPTRQLWVSSPFSGAHHFGYDAPTKQWMLENRQELRLLLDGELAHTLAGKS